jgi:hypothetical protein
MMGNRLEEGLCVRCGFPLIDLKFMMCVECTRIVAAQIVKIKRDPKSKGRVIRLPTKPGQKLGKK